MSFRLPEEEAERPWGGSLLDIAENTKEARLVKQNDSSREIGERTEKLWGFVALHFYLPVKPPRFADRLDMESERGESEKILRFMI